MRKSLGIFVVLMISMAAYAYDAKVGAFCFDLTESTATLVAEHPEVWEYPIRHTAHITIPDSISHNGKSYAVTAVGKSAFAYCSNLQEITLPATITEIDSFAFHLCPTLARITIPEGVQTIRAFAFYQCSSLTEIILPNTLKTIEQDAFSACESLKEITIPKSVSTICEPFLSLCPSLLTIKVEEGNTTFFSERNCLINKSQKRLIAGCATSVIPDNQAVTSIGNFAFAGATNLKEILIPEGITHIGKYAFALCQSLTPPVFPTSLTHLGASAFTGCNSLTKIQLPSALTTLEAAAFALCGGLIEITIPASLTTIGYGVLAHCPKLHTLTVDPANAIYHCQSNALICTATRELLAASATTSIPDDGSVTIIAQDAFAGNSNLYTIDLPNAITTIGNYAFSGCDQLTDVRIGQGIQTLSDRAFADCIALKSITFSGTTPPNATPSTFEGVAPEAVLHVPCAAIENYTQQAVWSQFSTIVGDLQYTFAIQTADVAQGEVRIVQEPLCNNDYQMLFVAMPKEGYVFQQWSDGNTDNPRTLILSQDTMLTASFVQQVTATALALNPQHLNMQVGETAQIKVVLTPENATAGTIRWTVDNEDIALVSNGKVVALQEGEASITAALTNGIHQATCTLTVIGPTSTNLPNAESTHPHVRKIFEDGQIRILITDPSTGQMRKYAIDGREIQ